MGFGAESRGARKARKLEDEDGIRPSFVPGLKVRETRQLVRFRENLGGLVRGELKMKVDRLRLALEMPLTEAQRWELAVQMTRHKARGRISRRWRAN